MHQSGLDVNLRGADHERAALDRARLMIETIGFLLFLLAIVFVAMGPKVPKNKPQDEDKNGPRSPDT